jgi:hypothetical protein
MVHPGTSSRTCDDRWIVAPAADHGRCHERSYRRRSDARVPLSDDGSTPSVASVHASALASEDAQGLVLRRAVKDVQLARSGSIAVLSCALGAGEARRRAATRGQRLLFAVWWVSRGWCVALSGSGRRRRADRYRQVAPIGQRAASRSSSQRRVEKISNPKPTAAPPVRAGSVTAGAFIARFVAVAGSVPEARIATSGIPVARRCASLG